jgi:tol-pal system protein YbgF
MKTSSFSVRSLPAFLTFCAFAAACVFVSSCATIEDTNALRRDISKLQGDAFSMRKDINDLMGKTAGVAKEESFHAVRESQAEIQGSLADASRDIQILSGRFDENKYYMEKSLQSTTSEIELLKLQIAGLEKQIREMKYRMNGSGIPESPGGGPPANAQGLVSDNADPSGKEAKYKEAYDALQGKQYAAARKKFEAFVREFPQTDLTDNAYFWIAETYYSEKNYEDSILAYETLLKKFPESQKAPGALYKQALSFIEIGDRKTGQLILEQLIARYPNTSEAEFAKKKRDDLKK